MTVTMRADVAGERACLVPVGRFGLAHSATVARAMEDAEQPLDGCQSVDIDLAEMERVDGTGAVLRRDSSIVSRRKADARACCQAAVRQPPA
jgi:phospholipid/cholesterol/gamma-HCH transport system permease protein